MQLGRDGGDGRAETAPEGRGRPASGTERHGKRRDVVGREQAEQLRMTRRDAFRLRNRRRY